MNLKFWNRTTPIPATPKPEPRTLIIPAENVRGILDLLDAYNRIEKGDRVAKFDLWYAIAEIFPEVRQGKWRLESENALEITILERLTSAE